MTKNNIAIPESVRYAFNNFDALDILSKQDSPPPTFNYEEVHQFNKGKNLVNLCKADLYQFICDIYNSIWDTTKLEPVLASELNKMYYYNKISELFHPQCAWNDWEMYWAFKSKANKFINVALVCGICPIEGSDKYKVVPSFALYNTKAKSGGWFTYEYYNNLGVTNWPADKSDLCCNYEPKQESEQCTFTADSPYIDGESLAKLRTETSEVLKVIEGIEF